MTENYYFFPQTEENILQFKAIQVAANCNTLTSQLIPIAQTDLLNQFGEMQKKQAAYFSLTWLFEDVSQHNAMLAMQGCVFFDELTQALNFIKNGLVTI